jgi:hypothetical protein
MICLIYIYIIVLMDLYAGKKSKGLLGEECKYVMSA